MSEFFELKAFFSGLFGLFWAFRNWEGGKERENGCWVTFFHQEMHLNCNNFSINWARKSGLVPNWSPEKYLSRLCLYFDNWLIWNRFLLKKWQKKRKKTIFLAFSFFFYPSKFRNAQSMSKRLEKKALSSKNSNEKILSWAPNLEFWAPIPPP